MEDEQWERALKANLSGAFYLLRAAGRVMVEQGSGSIILVGSIAGVSGLGGQGAYSASKSGLIGLVAAAAKDLGPAGVRVNLVLPSAATRNTEGGWGLDGLSKLSPLKRPGDPREVAQMVLFLGSDRSLVELEGDDHFSFAGDQDSWLDEVREFVTGSRDQPDPDRLLATVLFTDLVDSTGQASRLGDRRWAELLDEHDIVSRRLVTGHGGQLVKSTGDGILGWFDGPGRAVRCAVQLRDELHRVGLTCRAGLHAGEIERRGDDIGGMAVHIAARVEAHAAPGEVLVSRTVKDLVVGSSIGFEDRGVHKLKGVADDWQLLAVTNASY